MKEAAGPDKAKERQARMKAWLASLQPADRAEFEDTVLQQASPTREEAAAALRQALQRLPEEQRLAVFLVDVGGLSCREAAKEMKLSLATVEARVAAARETLQALLPPELLQSASRLGNREDDAALE